MSGKSKNTEDKNSFVLYASYIDAVEALPDEISGELFKMILRYVNGLEAESDNITAKSLFLVIKQQLDRDREKWEQTCAARSEAGKKGGRPRKEDNNSAENLKTEKTNACSDNKEKAKKANGFSEKQTKAKKSKWFF